MNGIRNTTIAGLVLALAVIAAGVAYGDYAVNTVDTTLDDDLEVLDVAEGEDEVTTIWVQNQNTNAGDTNNSCNLAGSNTALTLDVVSSDTDIATVAPAQITIVDCELASGQQVTVTGVAEGTATISFTIAANTGTGVFDLDPAAFTANVTAPANPCLAVATPDAPLISSVPASNDGNAGWFVTVPTVSASSTTAGAAISYATDGSTFSATPPTLGQGTTTVTAKATSATCDKTSTSTRTFMVDSNGPVVTPGDVTNTTWRNTSLSQTFAASDSPSGLFDETNDSSFTLTASAESANGSTPTTVSRTVYDVAGNSTTRTVSALIDLSVPTNVQFVGGPADGGLYFPTTVPAAPTCTADDVPSGLATSNGCVVTGHSSAVGTHTLTATATDKAGNQTTATRSYRVRTLTLGGFFTPVDMTSTANLAKAGSTVPLKFTVADEGVPQTSTEVVQSFTQAVIGCGTLAGTQEDAIEEYTSGKTVLRHDGAQFIQNWQTPRAPGACYRVTVTTIDGSTIIGYFKLK